MPSKNSLMINKIAILILFIFLFAGQYYPDMECKLVRVIDGDTIVCNIPDFPAVAGREVSIRFRHADAPEVRTKDLKEKEQGLIAKRNIEKVLWPAVKKGHKITLKNIGRGKYFRYVADVYIDGERFVYVYPRKKPKD